ncbi:PspC domain-containing protein [Saccharopolyspora sp. HNM0983]|uniref:PspC domain-containing protein n=1 Tax=Saccharopolyspora montiporae TaxID=2781240 RepID=A0A929B6E1_9PSEU|nr:PspC domain-containing protein [Saccharopolyspora sp. HNM0983]MBE9374069.1 PspC domain-containing protein [Saccharopolyspora sp. HNM0983]
MSDAQNTPDPANGPDPVNSPVPIDGPNPDGPNQAGAANPGGPDPVGDAGPADQDPSTPEAAPAGGTGAAHAGRTAGPPARLFRRSRDDAMIAGICGGAGKLLGVDPVLVRLAMTALALFGVGIGVLMYLVCWVIVPLEEPAPEPALPSGTGT